VEIESGRRSSPLEFEVRGRDDHNEAAGVNGEKLASCRQCECGLSCTWCRDREKVAPRSLAEPLERGALPGSQSNRTRSSLALIHLVGTGRFTVSFRALQQVTVKKAW
jgi:hypothetical protein